MLDSMTPIVYECVIPALASTFRQLVPTSWSGKQQVKFFFIIQFSQQMQASKKYHGLPQAKSDRYGKIYP